MISRLIASVALILSVAACAGSGGTGPASQPQTTRPGGAGGRMPGVSGTIAAASPGALQLQDATSQTTVTYTDVTTFSRSVPATLEIGQCVLATGSIVDESHTSMTATSVRIQTDANGSCTFPAGGRGGSGATRPSGAPPPSGAPDGSAGFASAAGKVTSVSDATVVIDGTVRSGRPQATTGSAPASTITVALSPDTVITKIEPATSAAAVVGQCATAIGPADDTGAVAATMITISVPGANGCSRGATGRPGRGGSGG